MRLYGLRAHVRAGIKACALKVRTHTHMLSARFAVNPAHVKLCVIRCGGGLTTLQLRVETGLLHPGVCEREGAFVCTNYYETCRTQYTAEDWLERYRDWYGDEDEDFDDAYYERQNQNAAQFHPYLAGESVQDQHFCHMRVVRNPSEGIFSRIHRIGMSVHSFALDRDDSGRGTTVTVGVPLRVVLCLLVQRRLKDRGNWHIRRTEFTSVRLEFCSV